MHKSQLILDTDQVIKIGFIHDTDKPLIFDYSLWKNRPNQICLINANKLSFVKGNLYNVRRKYLRQFSKSKINVDVFGSDWEKKSYLQILQQVGSVIRLAFKFLTLPSLSHLFIPLKQNSYLHFKGIVESKIKTYKNYKFALVIENDPDYVSEKIFDAILGGTVPLYLGGSLADFGIPNSVAINLPKDFKRHDFAFLNNETMIKNVLEAGNQWISISETFDYWKIDSGLNRLVDSLAENLDSSNEFCRN